MITKKETVQTMMEREAIKDWAMVERLSAVIEYASHPAGEVAQILGVATVLVIHRATDFQTLEN